MAEKRQAHLLRRVVRSLLFTLLMLAVIGALLWFGNAHKVLALVVQFKPIYILWFVFLLLAQEWLRWVLWYFLLQALATRVPVRLQLLAFAVGESAKSLPTGAYLQNYVLQRAAGTDFGRSSAATTVMIVGEIAAALLGFVILGAGAWSIWPRVAVIVIALVATELVRRYLLSPLPTRTPRWMLRHQLLVHVLGEFRRFRAGVAVLTDWRILGITMLLCVLYVLASGAGMYIVVLALGIGNVSFWQAVGVNCFGLAFYMVLGSIEAADVGAFIGIGVSNSAAVTVILVNRALGVGITLAFSAIVLVLLRDQWHTLRRSRTGSEGKGPPALPPMETLHSDLEAVPD